MKVLHIFEIILFILVIGGVGQQIITTEAKIVSGSIILLGAVCIMFEIKDYIKNKRHKGGTDATNTTRI